MATAAPRFSPGCRRMTSESQSKSCFCPPAVSSSRRERSSRCWSTHCLAVDTCPSFQPARSPAARPRPTHLSLPGVPEVHERQPPIRGIDRCRRKVPSPRQAPADRLRCDDKSRRPPKFDRAVPRPALAPTPFLRQPRLLARTAHGRQPADRRLTRWRRLSHRDSAVDFNERVLPVT